MVRVQARAQRVPMGPGHAESCCGSEPGCDVGVHARQREGGEKPDCVFAAVAGAVQVLDVLLVGDDLRDDEQVDRHAGSSLGLSVEVVGQAPVRGTGGHHEAGEGGSHDGAVGEPSERPVVGGRGELGPRREKRGGGVDIGGREDRVCGRQRFPA